MKKAMIGAGDEVFMAGLFNRLPSGRGNIPIARVGNISAIPNEKVSGISLGGNAVDAEVFLIEARSLGGLSGSPVFVREPISLHIQRASEWKKGEPLTVHLSGPFYFLGMMHGHWIIEPSEHNRYDFRANNSVNESIALGIAVAVPATKILETLNHP